MRNLHYRFKSKIKNLLTRLKIRLGIGFESKLEELRKLAGQGEWSAADALCQKLLSRRRDAEVLAIQAYGFQQRGSWPEAIAYATEAMALSPKMWMPPFIAGVSFAALGELEKSAAALRVANSIAPADYGTIRHLVGIEARLNGVPVAASEYRQLVHNVPNRSADGIVTAKIASVRSWSSGNNISLIEAGDVEEIPFKHPRVWGRKHEASVCYAPSYVPYVAEIPNAKIFGASGIILTENGFVLHDDAAHPEFGASVSFAYEKCVVAQANGEILLDLGGEQDGGAQREIPAGMFLGGVTSASYGHWIPEYLPKIQFFMKHPEFHRLPFIVDSEMPSSHFAHLERLAKNQIIKIKPGEKVLCRRLMVAPAPSFFPAEYLPHNIPVEKIPGLSPRAMRFVAGESQSSSVGQERIFLARKNMKWRRLLNEPEIIADLEKMGFRAVFLEELSAQDQIQLFQSAACIVAPNGSALLNVIFASTKTKLVVLTQPNLFNWGTFQGPMDALGYDSICVTGDFAESEGQKHSDYSVPVLNVRAALNSLGIN